jgi:uncharacterized protein YebE (UPF0316 family)
VEIFNNPLQLWKAVSPYVVFLAPIVQVSLMTMRTIFIARGMRWLATFSSFFEMSIWLFAMTQLLSAMNDWQSRTIYAACFASGVFLGSTLEERLSLGVVIVRMVVQQNTEQLIHSISTAGFGVTQTRAEGAFGQGMLLLSVVQRKRAEELISIIEKSNPLAFYWVEDVRSVNTALPLFWKNMGQRHVQKALIPGVT